MKYKPKTIRDWQAKKYAKIALLILAAILLTMCLIFGIAKP